MSSIEQGKGDRLTGAKQLTDDDGVLLERRRSLVGSHREMLANRAQSLGKGGGDDGGYGALWVEWRRAALFSTAS